MSKFYQMSSFFFLKTCSYFAMYGQVTVQKRNVIYDKVIQHRDSPNGLKNLHNPDVLIFLLH